MVAIPGEVSHVRVFLDRLAVVRDDSADADLLPDWVGVTGTVTMAPMLDARGLVVTSTGRAFLPTPLTFPLVDGSGEVTLVNSADPDITPRLWSYRVTVAIASPVSREIIGVYTPAAADANVNLMPLLPLSAGNSGIVVPTSLPDGGAPGTALVKHSATTGDVKWDRVVETGGDAKTSGAVFWGVFEMGAEPTPPADGKTHFGFRVSP